MRAGMRSVGWRFGVAATTVLALVLVAGAAAESASSDVAGGLDAAGEPAWHAIPPPNDGKRIFCFTPGTPRETIEYFSNLPGVVTAAERYFLGPRWSGGQGNPRVITWSFVPDGTIIVDGSPSPSNLFATLDAQFALSGGRATWVARIQQSFDRWEETAGIDFVRRTNGVDDWDSGGNWPTAGGNATRGEVRIAMQSIDGGSGVLAYTYFPSTGDMFMDSAENWASPGSTHRFLRNTVTHELGHALGIDHICSGNSAQLMEPFLSTAFDTLRHDDIRGAQRHYGDDFEPNNTSVTAGNLGLVEAGSPISLGAVPPPPSGSSPTNTSIISLDADTEVDYFKFTVAGPRTATVTIAPQGITYDNQAQLGSGACPGCCADVNSLAIANLNVELIDTDGVAVLATGAANGAGLSETAMAALPGAGDYFVRVFEANAPTQAQLYTLNLSVTAPADAVPPSPDPMTFAVVPAPVSTSSINMTATTAVDATTPPVQYNFEFMAGGAGGTTSGWQAGTAYADGGLAPNTDYTYRVKARDSVLPTPNETGPSGNETTATLIETPVTPLSFGTVTSTTVEMTATDGFSNLGDAMSGLFFDSTTPGGDGGLNLWIQTTTTTATGLTPNTLYTFQVKARNRNGVETAFGPPAMIMTPAVAGDCDGDGVFNVALDLPCFVDVLTGFNLDPGAMTRSDMNSSGIPDGDDIQEFVDCVILGC